MNELKGYSVTELKKEIDRREIDRPKLLGKPDITDLVIYCESYMLARSIGEPLKDGQYYIYEEVMECLYGESVWDIMSGYPEDERN